MDGDPFKRSLVSLTKSASVQNVAWPWRLTSAVWEGEAGSLQTSLTEAAICPGLQTESADMLACFVCLFVLPILLKIF